MVYKPTEEELAQLDKLNRGAIQIKEGLDLINKAIGISDTVIDMEIYRMTKSYEKILTRIRKVMETIYIDKTFINIIENSMEEKEAPKKKRKKSAPKKEDKKRKEGTLKPKRKYKKRVTKKKSKDK